MDVNTQKWLRDERLSAYVDLTKYLLTLGRSGVDQRGISFKEFENPFEGYERWTLSAGQLIDIVKWNLLCHIPVKMRGAEDDEEETTKSFTSV